MKRRRLDVDVAALCLALGHEVRRAGDELRGYCPDPAHRGIEGSSAARKEGPGTWQIKAAGPKVGLHTCYSCGFGGGPVTLVRATKGLTGPEAWRWLLEFCGETVPAGAYARSWNRKVGAPGQAELPGLPYPPESHLITGPGDPPHCQQALAYLGSRPRPVTLAECRRYRFAATPADAPKYKGRVIVPVVVDGEMVDFVARLWRSGVPETIPKALSGRADQGARKERALWGYDHLDPTIRVVIVVEGAWDALYLLRIGIPNVVAVCGSAWSPERTELLAPWDEVVLLPDADDAGEKFVRHASGLRFVCDVRWAQLPEGTQPEDHPPALLRQVIRGARPPQWHALDQVEIARWVGKI